MNKKINRILIVGAGEAGCLLAAELEQQQRAHQIIGYVDDDLTKQGQIFEGFKVKGQLKDAKKIVAKEKINQVIIAMPTASAEIINSLISDLLHQNKYLAIQILPEATRFFDNSLSNDLSDYSYAHFLDRKEYTLDLSKMTSFLQGKKILISGAGGSIGSEICRQLLRFGVKKIIAVGRGENSIYQLAKDLNQRQKKLEQATTKVHYKIADIRNYELMKKIMQEEEPEIIFHAAAHKHVPLMEFNAAEAVSNNLGGTENLLRLAQENSVTNFVLISTDKAVNPVNIMGATKRTAEILTRSYNGKNNLQTTVVRFGNVLGSRGSVIPLFEEQIENGGPVTVTHQKMKRFLMSIPEASLLVLNAVAFAQGGEIFMLEMGEQYSIDHLARKLIKLYGLQPEKDIKIIYTGLRPGEKLEEELSYSTENISKTENDKIFCLKNKEVETSLIQNFVKNELPQIYKYNNEEICLKLQEILPEFSHVARDQENTRIVN